MTCAMLLIVLILLSSNPDVSRDVIDLHGLTVAEALPIVDLICNALQRGLHP